MRLHSELVVLPVTMLVILALLPTHVDNCNFRLPQCREENEEGQFAEQCCHKNEDGILLYCMWTKESPQITKCLTLPDSPTRSDVLNFADSQTPLLKQPQTPIKIKRSHTTPSPLEWLMQSPRKPGCLRDGEECRTTDDCCHKNEYGQLLYCLADEDDPQTKVCQVHNY